MNPKNAVSLREDLVKLACADQPRYLMWRFCLAISNILIHSVSCHASCLYIQKIVYVSLRKICSARESTIYSSSRSVSCGFVLFRLNRVNATQLVRFVDLLAFGLRFVYILCRTFGSCSASHVCREVSPRRSPPSRSISPPNGRSLRSNMSSLPGNCPQKSFGILFSTRALFLVLSFFHCQSPNTC